MKDLDQHNKERYAQIAKERETESFTGIACPKCGTEMINPSPNMVLTSNPPQINVLCPKCDHRGYAVI